MEKKSDKTPGRSKKKSVGQPEAAVPAVCKESRSAADKKTVPVKKLPGLFRKKYTERSFSKKIRKRLFIAKDREFVESLFEPVSAGKKTFFQIPCDRTFSKKDCVRLKLLAKQIKKQKSRIKWVPLAAFVGVIAALVLTVFLFKDAMIKKGIRAGLESVFQAKCDIGSVHLGILDSRFSVRALAVADKNEPMTNLFEVDALTLDFDLVQLLKKRFAADVLELAGIRLGTPRKTDGTLPVKPAKRKESAPEKPKSQFQLELETFAAQKKAVAENSIAHIFAQYDPESLLENYYAQLKSPELARTVSAEMEQIVPAWTETPDILADSVNEVIADGRTVLEFDWQSIQSDPQKIKTAIERISAAVNSVTALQKETERTLDMLKRDSEKVKKYSAQLEKAVQADYSFVNKEINKITSFTVKDGQNFLTETFNSVCADLVGNYYPVVQQVLSYAEEYAGYLKDDSAKKVKKSNSAVARYSGRTVDFRKDTTPDFLIKKIHGSGSGERFSLDISVSDVCSDMDKWGKPVTFKVSAVHGAMKDALDGTFDVRTERTGSLLSLSYTGSGYPVTVSVPDAEAVPGVPTVAGTGSFSAELACAENGGFALTGGVLLDPVSITAAAFEPAFASNLYAKALAQFSSIEAGVRASYSDAAGLSLGVTSDIDRRCAAILQKLMNDELGALKESAAAQVKESLESALSGVTGQFSSFTELKNRIETQAGKLDDFKTELERKKKEGEVKLKQAAQDAVKDAAASAAEAAADSLKNLFNKQR